jgi:hypothetical protein
MVSMQYHRNRCPCPRTSLTLASRVSTLAKGIISKEVYWGNLLMKSV